MSGIHFSILIGQADGAWNTGGTREIAITLDNGKLQLFEHV